MTATSTRAYRSALRSEQAAATRQRVLEASALCFAERGYSGTSLVDIAERAGVSPETVKANGPKRDLLLRAFEHAFAGAEGEAPIAESQTGRELTAIAGDAEFVASVARFIADANARTSVLWTELLSAANADPEIAIALDGLLARRRDDYGRVIALLRDRGIVSGDAEAEASADALSFLWSPESHQQLVLQSGWTMEAYRSWLADTLWRQFRR
ncbi:TetR/AcrR family transcriptional regulator [Microbacterium sp. B2969]|uniref:TetR/AcrR family transcriptional regulator n=1 Tax=Microbacterium alkaliflavum TaxID=3248839 RepID=A0ABW7Q629_9MICO